ncbi:MAG TPA: EamA family transporter RarD [Herpetosiphon sp.]|uniref:RarD protein, DMT superfamily transporter n=1 Tax=Herpetosiphon aurantiacus (strain ATCC 23779 / DSM 785 / 114-95) TaxID=316274 RepID=A9B5S1_HERA2|nr:EamA family transporter RarD [Herpetosiphon sp.]ABX04304.1 RarD protein, DMT superfamily transporter [Herpetosiphon aurantiacus DSM 785]HBW51908.1 EamA family transporter RarD [Herpetosiphon sp.]
MKRGILYAAGAYACWGFFPLYWKLLNGIPALEILAHRMAWSLVFVGLLVVLRGQMGQFLQVLRNRRTVLIYATSAFLLGINWYVYIWAVNANHVVESSLGYFINPLVNVALGMLFLGERVRRWQAMAIGLATIGVVYLTVALGVLPWIALALAFTFGFYGLIRKTAALDSLQGLALETVVFFGPAAGYLLWLETQGKAAFGHQSWTVSLILAGAGIVTAIPLLMFAAGARQIPMTTLGLLQYINPTMQFSLGVLLYHEPISGTKLIGFAIIWIALALYSFESYLNRGQIAKPAAQSS